MTFRSIIIGNRYEMRQPLGEGSQGYTFMAWDALLSQEVVIKASRVPAEKSLPHEYALLTQLHHPHLVQALDLFYQEGQCFLVQSFAPGPDFATWAASQNNSEELYLGAAAIFRVLQYLQSRHIIHRDIKPSHIRVNDKRVGKLPGICLIDFGLALTPDSAPGSLRAGTPNYLAPEVLAGEPASWASDLYSVGAVFFETLLGYPPPITLASLAESPHIPSSIKDTHWGELITNLLHPRPECRPVPKVCLATLSSIIGHSLDLSINELREPYLPRPSIVGRKTAITRLKQLIEEAKNGHSIAIQLAGCGKSAMARVAVTLGKIASFQVIEPDRPLSLFKTLIGVEKDPNHLDPCITKVIDALVSQAKDGPLLLNFDHWEDHDPIARRMVSQLVEMISQQEAPGCVLLWSNALTAAVDTGWEIINLECLDAEETAEVVRGMLYAIDPPLWINQIYQETSGDPRWIVEIVWAQIEAGLPDSFALSMNRAELAQRRLERLAEEEKRLLAIIALSPRPIPSSILNRVVPSELLAVLPTLLSRQVVSMSAHGLYPAHSSFKAIARQFLMEDDKTLFHQRLAHGWQSEENVDPLALGHHLLRADRVREGLDMLFTLPVIPADELEHALSILASDHHDLTVIIQQYLARFYRESGNLQRGLSAATHLAKHFPDAGRLLQAEILLDAGMPGQALMALEQTLESNMAQKLFKARACFLQGDYTTALGETQEGLQTSGSTPLLIAQLQHLAGLCLIYLGKAVVGLSLLEPAEQAARQIGHIDTQARLWNSRGIAFQRLGRLEEATKAYQTSLQMAQDRGDLRLSASATQNLGTLALHRLELANALFCFQRAHRLAQRGQVAGTTAAFALANEANLLLMIGAWTEAGLKLKQAEILTRQVGAQSQLGHIYIYHTKLHLGMNQLDRANDALQRAKECFSSSDIEGNEVTEWLNGELHFRLADYVRSRQICDALLESMSWKNPNRWQVHLLSAKIAMQGMPIDLNRAIQELEQSLSFTRLLGAADRNWEPYVLLANCYHQLDSQDEAAFYARRFQETIERFRQQIPPVHRLDFDRRDDVQQAQAIACQLSDPSLRAIPSREELKQLLEVNKALNRQVPVETLLQNIIDLALQLTGAERGFAILQENDTLQCLASSNVDKVTGQELTAFSRSLARLAITNDQAILVANAADDIRLQELISVQELKLRAVLCVPLRIQGKPRGAIYVDHQYMMNVFHKRHAELLQAFAEQVGIALESARLLEEAQEQQAALAAAKMLIEQEKHVLQGEVSRKAEELYVSSWRLREQEEELLRRYQDQKIIGRSKVMREIYLRINRIAESDLPVFIYGESGTGKELIARAIHYVGARKKEPFISINCAAIPKDLLESELFGHVKGAFTGAHRDRPGLFEVASHGTLFLDEIGDLPLEMQSKLLRVLQENVYRRVGESFERTSDCRILSASNQRLSDLVSKRAFRQDLYYRLNVLVLEIPPLRERREDIPLLIQHFVASGTTISPGALGVLMDYDWPGNIRELENEIQRAQLLSGGAIDRSHLSAHIQPRRKAKKRAPAMGQAVHDYERQLIESALLAANNNISAAAKRLGMHRTTLYYKMNILGMKVSKKTT